MFVVSGVTGNTGSIVAQTLIDQGQLVRVIVRSEEKGAAWRASGAEVAIVADFMDRESMSTETRSARFLQLPILRNCLSQHPFP